MATSFIGRPDIRRIGEFDNTKTPSQYPSGLTIEMANNNSIAYYGAVVTILYNEYRGVQIAYPAQAKMRWRYIVDGNWSSWQEVTATVLT